MLPLGDEPDATAFLAAVRRQAFLALNFRLRFSTDIAFIDGILNWVTWPSNGNQQSPSAGFKCVSGEGRVIASYFTRSKYIVRETFPVHFR
jgi:hypothetical protein